MKYLSLSLIVAASILSASICFIGGKEIYGVGMLVIAVAVFSKLEDVDEQRRDSSDSKNSSFDS